MVRTDEAKAQADAQDDLELSRDVGPVEHLRGRRQRPRRSRSRCNRWSSNDRGGDQRERNLELGTSWFQHQDEWAAMPADDGPAEWQRIDVAGRPRAAAWSASRAIAVARSTSSCPAEPIEAVPLDRRSRVSNVDVGDQSISFERRSGRCAGAGAR